MMRVAVVGAGDHSTSNHGPSLRDLSIGSLHQVELAAVCDLDLARAEEYSNKFGFRKAYGSIRSMLANEKLDAIVAVTPLSDTREVVGELLTHRIPSLLEKPPGQNLSETKELLEIAAEFQTPNMVSFNRRFVPAIQIAVDWLDGVKNERKPHLLIARMLRNERRESGFIMGTGIHLVDTVLSFFQEPIEITTHRDFGIANGSRCEGRIGFSENRSAILVIEPVAGVNEESYEIVGTGYRVLVELEKNEVTIWDMGDWVIHTVPSPDTPAYVMAGCYDETEAFLRAVAGAGAYSPTLVDAVESMMVAEALDRGYKGRL